MAGSPHADTVVAQLHQFSAQADERTTPHEAAFSLSYLDAFGYFAKELTGWKDISLGDVVNAVLSFQKFFGLQQTGQLDTKTVRAMEMYRCGCPDVVQSSHPSGIKYSKIKQFATANLARWKKTSLKYCVSDYVSGLGKMDQDAIIAKAFSQWSDVANIRIEASRDRQCDIVISTGQGQRSNFDGPGGVLAWAYMPDGNDQQLLMRFDIDETWITDPQQRGILMLNVATHEFGHLLGLDHSKVQTALMAPYYNVSITKPQQNDDIPRIVARYGAATPTTPPSPPPSPPPTPAGKRIVSLEIEGSITSARVVAIT